MNENSGSLAVRALNHWYPVYLPTYVALRLLLEQVPKSKNSDYIESYIRQKISTSDLCKYHKFLRFKEFSPEGTLEYRPFYAASPSSALGEAYILKLLSKVRGLWNPDCVFSYLWPKNKKEGRSYQYFFSGHAARQRQVSSLLRSSHDSVLLVNDIHSFYPSISRDVVCDRLQNHLTQSELGNFREVIIEMCKQILQNSDSGVPVGPAIGHVFGNIALENVDREMQGLYKKRYLRYVDDIFVVADRGGTKRAQDDLRRLVETEGLSLHGDDGKKDQITSSDWLDNVSTPDEESCGDAFDILFTRIRLLLWHRPEKLKPLQKQFRAKGIAIPLRRLATDARYGRFQWYMKRYVISSRGKLPSFFMQYIFDNENTILTNAIQLRTRFLERVKQITIDGVRPNGMVRRLRTQRLRFLLNRLVYLSRLSDFPELIGLTPDVSEFFEYRSFLQAIVTNRLDTILGLPGSAVATFGSFFKELESNDYPTFNLTASNPEAVLESVCTLALFNAIQIPDAWTNGLSNEQSELVKFCQFSAHKTRSEGNQSFEDEIRTLQLGEPSDKSRSILDSRFSDMESASLEALLFSDNPS